jgi:hypothetical protein
VTRAGLALRGAAAVARRPALWPAALGAALRLAPSGWWRRPPFLPLPDPAYWQFRMETAFGADARHRPRAHEIIEYLAWCQRSRPRSR